MLLAVLAIATGNVAMAVTIGENGSDTDPNDGKPLDDATPDNPGKGIDQQGHASTASALRDADIVEDKIVDYVSKFQSRKFPMHTDMLRLAKQVKVDTKEPENYVIGEAIMDCTMKSTGYTVSTSGDSAYAAEVDFATLLFNNDKKLFCENATIIVDGVEGYDESGTADGSPLMLIVTAKSATSIVVEAVNGPLHSSAMYVPSIPGSSVLHVLAPALSESEVEVAPDNAAPMPEKCYLQKKACAVTYTELFERIKKKANWNVQDVKDWQLAMFRKKCTRSMLISAPSKRLKSNSKTGAEYQYTEKGILRQIRLGYQTDSDKMTVEDHLAIAKVVFGPFSTTSVMDVYCGSDRMEKIANTDFSGHPEYVINQTKDLDIEITSVKTPFGTLNYKLEYGLDDLGYGDYAIAFSMADAKHFYYQKGKTITIDHEKGEGGEVREAKSQYFIQDDCLAIKGYNSLLIGPNVAAGGFSNIGTTVIAHSTNNALPSVGLAAGQVYYFTVDVTASSVTYPKGLYEYDGTAFLPYEGVING